MSNFQTNFIYTFLQFIHKIYVSLFINYNVTRILYESNNFIIVDKAYDLKINSNDKNERTVQTFMKKKYPLLASSDLHHDYYFVHRLDYATSGLMCIPIHKEACRVASKAIQERRCKKYYIALVRGYPSSNLIDLNLSIGRNVEVKEIEKMCVSTDYKARHARSVIMVLEKGLFDNYPAAKVLVRPITGRRHQIRVHCSHIGHTIVGDYTYSNKKDVAPKRMYLHSFKLVIPNRIEDINVNSHDPLDEKNVEGWKCVKKYCELSDGVEQIDRFIDDNTAAK